MDFATVVPPYVAKPLQLRPFRAVMLAPRSVGDPASARTLSRPYRDDADRLAEWISSGRASRDEAPALYLHEYTAGGLTVRGLVGALDVARRAHDAPSRAVWPHEAVHPEQAAELATRMQRLDLNPAPILLVHDGSDALRTLVADAAQPSPAWTYVDRADQRHRIWTIRDPHLLHAIEAELATSHCLLADGHHRYAAYLALQERHPGTPWDCGLAMLVDQRDTPLFLGAIHRTLAGAGLGVLEQVARAQGAQVDVLPRHAALSALDTQTAVATDGSTWMSIRPMHRPDRAIVEWLHHDLVSGLPEAPTIAHHHHVEDALGAAGPANPAVLLPSPAFGDVRAIVETGRLLPEKATSFQPKPSVGVLMRPVHDG
ncbi:MAG: Related to HTH domain of SpoOJ/ParA/ParB/repB family, involved in chromosome partitioning [uncultured Nocardioides sp.]|uniref:Related to HTH domain of SpoOJ/ParA/ParB/repB family, involved in chromosome partitioning n=1 Tax=uncultured Nocardioides sp. TaxID=198441 RepID=A0A6J4NNV6_9ACTN|nr:MAG: Related to HTH domain of SpoOJ/ParA/ParB/repB family, involved in chromosome partitioning [uncultured Nocardioides sp.]